MTPRAFLNKSISMREAIMRKQPSAHNHLSCAKAINQIKPWLQAYPKATDQQVAAHILRNYLAIQVILPGGNAASAPTLQTQLHQLLNTYTYVNIQQHTVQ